VCDVTLLIVYIAGCTQLTATLSYVSEQDYTRFEHIPLLDHFLGSRQQQTHNFCLAQPRIQFHSAMH